MTSPAITVLTTTTIADAAKTMNRENVKSLPVVNLIGRLIGIVSRGDLLKVPPPIRQKHPPRHRRRHVQAHPHWSRSTPSTVEVDNGAVRLAGKSRPTQQWWTANQMVASVSGSRHRHQRTHRAARSLPVGRPSRGRRASVQCQVEGRPHRDGPSR